jgi:hypothetical protein
LGLQEFSKAHKAAREALHLSPSQILLDLKNRVEKESGICVKIIHAPLSVSQLREEFGDLPVDARDTSAVKGRGLFATQEMPDGALLFVEAPLVTCFDSDKVRLRNRFSVALSFSCLSTEFIKLLCAVYSTTQGLQISVCVCRISGAFILTPVLRLPLN